MQTRIAKFGTFTSTIGENIAYGTTGGKEIVLQLIIDDGVPSRGHRTNIFKPEFLILGSWSSGHLTYSSETVIDYAGGMTTNDARAPVKNYDCTTGQGVPASTTTASTCAAASTTPEAQAAAAAAASAAAASAAAAAAAAAVCRAPVHNPVTPPVAA